MVNIIHFLLFFAVHIYFKLNTGNKLVLQLIVTLSIAAPSFIVAVDPRSIAIPKSHDFHVACTATSLVSLNVDKDFSWTSDPIGIISSFSNSQGVEDSSTATVHSSTPGMYTCQVTVSVPGDEPVITENSSTINVLGKSYYEGLYFTTHYATFFGRHSHKSVGLCFICCTLEVITSDCFFQF